MRRFATPRFRALRLAMIVLGGVVSGCALLAPLPPEADLEERLAVFPIDNLPLAGAVTIHWDRHQIPFIEAEHDGDAAFALGLVHAHLRLGQMAVFKRIAQGRIAEMVGPLAADIDHGIRILGFARAAERIEAALPPATRTWLTRFVQGINTYQDRAAALPPEYRILKMDREPWTAADILTFGRLVGTDFNWIVWFSLLQLQGREDWPEIWSRIVREGAPAIPDAEAAARLGALLATHSRSGSNSIVVSPSRAASAAALIASDPHLGIGIPNVWVLAGLKSPSHHAVGLMVPGLPIFAIGRNPWIAWGGTNMRAVSSTLVDVSRLPDDQIRERRERIGVRWWFDREVVVRETPYGPILSDAPQLQDIAVPAFALRWTGHDVSDEISAMLAVSLARTLAQYRDALRTFAVPAQNMLYADAQGAIAEVMAARLPAPNDALRETLIVSPEVVDAAWGAMRGSDDLPVRVNPKQGFLASANNRPADNADLAIGSFFSPDDRVERMAQLAREADKVDPEGLGRLQRDVYMASAAALRDLMMAKLDASGIAAEADLEQRKILDLMRAWDGHFRPESRGALAYELFRNRFSESFYAGRLGSEDWAAFASVAGIQGLLPGDIARADLNELAPLLRGSLAGAAADIAGLGHWGDIHRLGLNHPLAYLPVVGRRFRFADHPVGGSNETLMKTAHGTTRQRHAVRYGSNARHISDLSDIDRNDFVLLGGQDGWINSTTFLDQVPLWLEGRFIQLPLRPETVHARSVHHMELRPAEGVDPAKDDPGRD